MGAWGGLRGERAVYHVGLKWAGRGLLRGTPGREGLERDEPPGSPPPLPFLSTAGRRDPEGVRRGFRR